MRPIGATLDHMRGIVTRRTACAAAVLVVGAAAPTAFAAPAPAAAIRAAKVRAAVHYGSAHAVSAQFSLRSIVNRRWALVTGVGPTAAGGVRRLWAVWLKLPSGGRWRAIYFIDDKGVRGREFRPLRQDQGRAPCDLVPAYSEPDC
jgi:hypothetical protein